jgi:pimeloyl-ACP methyl ester carboxylesterase
MERRGFSMDTQTFFLRTAGGIYLAACLVGGQARPSNFGESAEAAAAPGTPLSSAGGYFRPQSKKRVIVFVNGIFGDSVSTWKNDSDGAYWPDLMAKDHDFDETDIYIHSFQSPKLSTAQEIGDLAVRLRTVLTLDHVLEHEKVVFLVHSMGGLVTRAMLVKTRLPYSKFPMIYFFATPTAGADVAGIAAHLSENPQLKNMLPLADNTYVKTLREEWLQTSNEPELNYPSKIASFCSYELRDTWHVRIVRELSATYLCNQENTSIVADHIGIVKPKDVRDDPYMYFKRAYQQTFAPDRALLSAAIAVEASKPMPTETRTVSLGTDAAAKFSLVQRRATSKYIDVGCEERKEGELDTNIKLAEYERVVEVLPTISNAVNVKASAAALIHHTIGSATVKYWIQGPDRQFLNCHGGGHADVVVNYVLEHGKPWDSRNADSTR